MKPERLVSYGTMASQVQTGGAQPALFAAVLVENPGGFSPSHGGNTGSNPVGDATLL
jgi:hypothetical protein